MTKEDEIYFDNYFGLFRNKGWQQLVEELKKNAVMVNSVEFTSDGDNLFFRKGQLDILAFLVNLENNISETHSQALEADEIVEEDSENP